MGFLVLATHPPILTRGQAGDLVAFLWAVELPCPPAAHSCTQRGGFGKPATGPEQFQWPRSLVPQALHFSAAAQQALPSSVPLSAAFARLPPELGERRRGLDPLPAHLGKLQKPEKQTGLSQGCLQMASEASLWVIGLVPSAECQAASGPPGVADGLPTRRGPGTGEG